jgi:SOS-response transcriptional repressor LexA
LVLANVAGHGQLVKRLRISADGEATLESENPDFKPIKVKESADLRIHGKVIWRCGLLR